MNLRQHGFSTALASLALLAATLSAFTVVEFKSFVDKARVAEAFHIADQARLRVNEFYLMSDRFPSTESEIDALTRAVSVPSDYVLDIVLEQSFEGHEVALRIYLDENPAPGMAETSPFVVVAGHLAARGGRNIAWSCGANGVAAELLPSGCAPVDG